MPLIDNFSAWIEIGGVKAVEYDVQQYGNTLTCWIASEGGKTFSVHWKDVICSLNTSGRTWVDGTECKGGKYIRSSRYPKCIETCKSQVRTSALAVRSLVFADLELTDDDTYLNSLNSQHIGEIKLEIWHTKLLENKEPARFSEFPMSQKLHERSKKAVSHCVSLGNEIKDVAKPVIRVKDIRLLVAFIFKYRPLDLLQANGIAPAPKVSAPKRERSPSPPLVVEDNETAEEIQALEARLRELRRKQGSLAKRVKLEGKVKAEDRATTKLEHIPGEVIDLT